MLLIPLQLSPSMIVAKMWERASVYAAFEEGQNDLTSPCFRKQGAIMSNFKLSHQEIFAPIEFR